MAICDRGYRGKRRVGDTRIEIPESGKGAKTGHEKRQARARFRRRAAIEPIIGHLKNGRFRRDLYYRLSIFPITVPSLREHPEDIPQLVWEFVGEFGERMGKKIRRIASRDMDILQSYAWPGNVRELRNVIEHSLIVSTGETLHLQRLSSNQPQVEKGRSLEDMERQYILSVLKSTRNRIKGAQGAAAVLQMKPSTLYSRMRKLGIVLERS